MSMKKERIKVLLVSPYSDKRTGGIGTWSKIVLDYAQNHSPCTVVFLNTVQGLPKRWSMNYKLAYYAIGFFDSLLIIVRLFGLMLIKRPDVVHYTSSAGSALHKDLIAIFIVKNIFRKKFVIHWHFGRIPYIFEDKGKEFSLFVKVCGKVNCSITIDERSYQMLKQEGIKVVNIPNPIPVALQNEAQQLSLQDLHSKRKRGIVLFVGHVLRGKGIYELVKSCVLCDEVKQLVVVGPFFDENVKEELVDISKQREGGQWLHIVGEKIREDVWNYYSECNVFCLPSYSEGFPYVILEAMAFGCPIVATNVGAIPEMLEGGCGKLIEAKQVEPLRKALTEVLSHETQASVMGERAHEKVLSEYTIEKAYGMYKDVWESLIE